MAVAALALFVALTSTGVASSVLDATTTALKKNSVGSKQIKNRQVKHADLGRNSVHGINLCADCVTGREVRERTLGKVPTANAADRSSHADEATTATTAGDSANLGGAPPSAYVSSSYVRRIPLTKVAFGDQKDLLDIPPFRIVGRCSESFNRADNGIVNPGGDAPQPGDKVGWAVLKNLSADDATVDVASPDIDWGQRPDDPYPGMPPGTTDDDDDHHFNPGEEQLLATTHLSNAPGWDAYGDVSGLNRGYVMAKDGTSISFETMATGMGVLGYSACTFWGEIRTGKATG
jgi:hypothetical protein